MFPERQCDSITYTISYTIVFFLFYCYHMTTISFLGHDVSEFVFRDEMLSTFVGEVIVGVRGPGGAVKELTAWPG